MFESLKKKFSRTSEKLEEELIEEAEAEDNLQEESGSRFSFFSFGRKKKEEEPEKRRGIICFLKLKKRSEETCRRGNMSEARREES